MLGDPDAKWQNQMYWMGAPQCHRHLLSPHFRTHHPKFMTLMRITGRLVFNILLYSVAYPEFWQGAYTNDVTHRRWKGGAHIFVSIGGRGYLKMWRYTIKNLETKPQLLKKNLSIGIITNLHLDQRSLVLMSFKIVIMLDIRMHDQHLHATSVVSLPFSDCAVYIQRLVV